jgi:hypothetical protein
LLGAAEKRDISLSGLVNKTLKNYTSSEMYLEELGFILVSKTFLRKIFDRLDENEIEEIGKEYGLIIAEEYVSYFYSQVNSNTLISFLEIWFRRFQSYQHRIDDNDGGGSDRNKKNKRSHYFTVSHDINMRFSLVLQSILGGLIEPIIKSPVEFRSVTANTITFSFETN